MERDNENPQSGAGEHLEYGETHPPGNDLKEQRAGPQDNQLTGETEEGARNQEAEGKNPQGNPPDRWSR